MEKMQSPLSASDPYYSWETDANGFCYPTVHWPSGLNWKVWHSVSEGCDQIDGYIGPSTLDIWYSRGAEVNDLLASYPEIDAQAAVVWDGGEVLMKRLWPRDKDKGIPSLIIPAEGFTEENLLEAFRRYRP